MNRIVDASVACKWYLDEPGSEQARRLVSSRGLLIAPDLIIAEVGNVLWKRARSAEIAESQINEIVGHLPAALLLIPVAELFAAALNIARRLDHAIYDCFYLATAERWDAPLITADKRLFERLRISQWSKRSQLLDVGG